MSRSYRKHPFSTDYSRTVTRWEKRMANKAARRYKYYLPVKGKLYRRIYNPWFIHDWKCYESEMMARKWFRDIQNDDRRNFLKPVYQDYSEEDYINKIYKKYAVRK